MHDKPYDKCTIECMIRIVIKCMMGIMIQLKIRSMITNYGITHDNTCDKHKHMIKPAITKTTMMKRDYVKQYGKSMINRTVNIMMKFIIQFMLT